MTNDIWCHALAIIDSKLCPDHACLVGKLMMHGETRRNQDLPMIRGSSDAREMYPYVVNEINQTRYQRVRPWYLHPSCTLMRIMQVILNYPLSLQLLWDRRCIVFSIVSIPSGIFHLDKKTNGYQWAQRKSSEWWTGTMYLYSIG